MPGFPQQHGCLAVLVALALAGCSSVAPQGGAGDGAQGASGAAGAGAQASGVAAADTVGAGDRSTGSLPAKAGAPGVTDAAGAPSPAGHAAGSVPAPGTHAGVNPLYCRNLYEALEGQVHNRHVMDAGEQRLPGYLFLRTNRFLASYARDFEAMLEGRMIQSAHRAEGQAAADARHAGNVPQAGHVEGDESADAGAKPDPAAISGLIDAQRRLAQIPDHAPDRIAARQAALLQAPAFRDWLLHLQQLDTHVRQLEVSRLPEASFPLYQQAGREQVQEVLQRCGPIMVSHLAPADVPRLLGQARVPDEYRRALRALGMYPLTGIGVASSIRNWEAEQRRVFHTEHRPSQSGRVSFQRYQPAQVVPGPDAWRTAAQVMRDAPRDALGIPQLSEAQKELLFLSFAPTFEIATTTDSDRIGRMQWIDLAGLVRDQAERFWLDVDTNVPVVYTRLDFTRFGDAVLPQLEYLVWFSERPMQGRSDLHGGRLDGLVWRVTLDTDGAPLIYDSIHPSGRYAMFFPTRRLQLDRLAQESVEKLTQWVYSPIDGAVEDWLGEKWPGSMSLRISSGTHQLVGLSATGKTWGRPVFDNPPYRMEADDALRALPVPGDVARSIYNQNGFVSGTERLGRWLFWATGISNVGAMRQAGRQPTALIGRRHFDDPYLFQKRYLRVPVQR